jgi:Undecaprenyl-phosphate galactose phosphotransferase WbaP
MARGYTPFLVIGERQVKLSDYSDCDVPEDLCASNAVSASNAGRGLTRLRGGHFLTLIDLNVGFTNDQWVMVAGVQTSGKSLPSDAHHVANSVQKFGAVINELGLPAADHDGIGTMDSNPKPQDATFDESFVQKVIRAITSEDSTSGELNTASYNTQYALTALPLVLMDVLALAICLLTGMIAMSAFGVFAFEQAIPNAVNVTFAMIIAFMIWGLYGPGLHPIFEFRQTTVASSFVFLLIIATQQTAGQNVQWGLFFSYPLAMILVPLNRSIARRLLEKSPWWGVKCVVIGCHERVNSLYKQHIQNQIRGLRPVGFLDEELSDTCAPEYRGHYLGKPSKATKVREELGASCALVHRLGRPDHELVNFVAEQLSGFPLILILPDDHRLPMLWAPAGMDGISLKDRLLQPEAQITKRVMDLVVSISALIALSPLLVFITLWLKLTDPGPLFFGHRRIGKGGRHFPAWKFRSMVVNAQEVLEEHLAKNPEMRAEWEATQKLKNDPRVTAVGRFLRKTSLDELPQLWNVIRGDMTLVGPRPIVDNEVEKYEETFENYMRVLPGITGWWQVSGRNLTTYTRRVELDDFYVRNWSLWFDLYILYRTVKTVLFREGAF